MLEPLFLVHHEIITEFCVIIDSEGPRIIVAAALVVLPIDFSREHP